MTNSGRLRADFGALSQISVAFYDIEIVVIFVLISDLWLGAE